jgi:hypothetical protein
VSSLLFLTISSIQNGITIKKRDSAIRQRKRTITSETISSFSASKERVKRVPQAIHIIITPGTGI